MNYDPATNILINKGFLVLTVNFSGTLSHGKEFNERIAGKIGDLCVSEIMQVVETLQEKNMLTKEKLHYEGGSYSGYLGFVLLQKYPKMFKSMIIRNPLVNMFHSTFSCDIPSWVSKEALGKENKFDITQDFTNEELQKLKDKSPGIAKFEKSDTVVRVFLGGKDKRVPNRAMIYLFKKLKEIGIDIKVNVYENCGHGITRTEDLFEMKLNQMVNCAGDFLVKDACC